MMKLFTKTMFTNNWLTSYWLTNNWLTNIVLLSIWLSASTVYADNQKILFVSAQHSNKAKVSLIKKIAASEHLTVDQKPEKQLGNLNEAQAIFKRYDLVIFDAVSVRRTKQTYTKYQSAIKTTNTKFLAIKAPDETSLQNDISAKHAKTLFDYYENGGRYNFERLAKYLRYKVFSDDLRTVAKPIIFPKVGIYHPDAEHLVFASRAHYLKWRPQSPANKTTVGLMIQRSAIEAAQTQAIDATIHSLEQRGVNVITFFFELSPMVSDYSHLIQDHLTQGKHQTVVDIIINFRSIHWANQRKVEFEKFGVPVIQALTYYDGNQQDWEDSKQGISAGMAPFLLVLPEMAGVIDPTIIAAVNQDTEEVDIIDYQLEHLINRTLRYASLKHKPNRDKKLTVMFWGDRDMGASFLNVPDSLRAISSRLNSEGYNVKKVEKGFFISQVDAILSPFYGDYQLEELLNNDLADTLSIDEYRRWFAILPKAVQNSISQFWGEPEDNFMAIDHGGRKVFVIPRIRNGNMLVMRQPPRGDSADQDQQLYHKGTVPMNHYYLAAYFYAREYWGSDSIVHLGTHGSQEYLPGKERGLSRYDGGNLAVWDTPVMYPFIADDVGEAMQTKRRGSAVVVSHMTPPYAAAGLQGVTADIHQLMHEYDALDEGGVKVKTGSQIVQTCIDESICKDLGWAQQAIDADFKGFLEALHDYLTELAAQNQPLGLHTFGELPEPVLQTSTLVQMLGSTLTSLVSVFEAEHYASADEQNNGDKRAHIPTDEKADADHLPVSADDLENITGFKTVRDFVIGDQNTKKLPKPLRESVIKGKEYYNNMRNIQELDNLINGLAGRYVPVKTGGDPVRHPDSLPTGLNLYGFDPSRLPTKAAFAQGKALVEDVIANYYRDNGHYPDKLAFSLWSIEAMRHYGVLEAQAMYAMGIRPVWSQDGRVVDTEIIPASQLKRPRVDVVLSATGLYRDAFPNVIEMLAKAIEKITQLKEHNNSLWENSERIKATLVAEGVDSDEAQYLSSVRIFSNASGDYGSGVSGPIGSSDTWDNDAKIADNYLYRMGFAFGADPSRWGQRIEGLYGKQLSGTDIAMFSRSSNLYGMITSDDPYEYFGSLALAVRNLDGTSPQMMVSNLRDANHGKMENAARFLAKELRTRNFNERWIKEMQKEGYSGAVTVSSNLSNFWGWQVVDPNLVRDDQWQEFFEVYIEDKLELGMNEWFEQVNPAAQAQMLERMLESVRKDYWQADARVQQVMIERLAELVEKYDLFVENEKLIEFVNQQAVGFGLNAQLPAPTHTSNTAKTLSSQQDTVSGQKLEKIEQQQNADSEWELTWMLTLLICLICVLAGAWRQSRPCRQFRPMTLPSGG
jgi:cobaltochelatase CobN